MNDANCCVCVCVCVCVCMCIAWIGNSAKAYRIFLFVYLLYITNSLVIEPRV
jgi:hypothetical protein